MSIVKEESEADNLRHSIIGVSAPGPSCFLSSVIRLEELLKMQLSDLEKLQSSRSVNI